MDGLNITRDVEDGAASAEAASAVAARQEPAKPLKLSVIEGHLLDKELDILAGRLKTATQAFERALNEASGDSHYQSRKAVRDAIQKRMDNGYTSFEGWNLKEALTEDGKRAILKRVTADFLARVEEIGQIAEDAASRVED